MNFDVQLRKRTNNKANLTMKLFSLITACLITNLVAIPINIDSDDLATVDQIQSSHELTPEILAEPNDLVGNNGQCEIFLNYFLNSETLRRA